MEASRPNFETAQHIDKQIGLTDVSSTINAQKWYHGVLMQPREKFNDAHKMAYICYYFSPLDYDSAQPRFQLRKGRLSNDRRAACVAMLANNRPNCQTYLVVFTTFSVCVCVLVMDIPAHASRAQLRTSH